MRDNPFKVIFALSLLLNFILLTTAAYVYSKARYQISPIDYSFQNLAFEPRRPFSGSNNTSLSEEQLRIMRGKLMSFQAMIVQKRQEVIKKRLDLINILRSETQDSKAIDAAISQISDIQEDIERTAVAHIVEGKDFLNKNQQQRFLDRLEEAMLNKKHSVYEQEYPIF